jgi:hypothetical protein
MVARGAASSHFSAVSPADENALAAFKEAPSATAKWVACYNKNVILSDTLGASPTPVGVFADERKAVAVGRLHPHLGLVDRLISSIPKEEVRSVSISQKH